MRKHQEACPTGGEKSQLNRFMNLMVRFAREPTLLAGHFTGG